MSGERDCLLAGGENFKDWITAFILTFAILHILILWGTQVKLIVPSLTVLSP